MTYIERLLVIKKNEKSLFKSIANSIHNKLKTREKLYKASQLAKALNISNALITRFVSKMQYENWSVMKYIHNNILENQNIARQAKPIKIKKIANLINSARKILFIGVSTNLFVNKDFAQKLTRLDKWVVSPENKYEQIGLSKLLSYKDVMIVNSISLQHEWMIDIINQSKSKVILISANNQNLQIKKSIEVLSVGTNKQDVSPSRTYTTQARSKVVDIYDAIYEYLISLDGNSQLLKLTAYN